MLYYDPAVANHTLKKLLNVVNCAGTELLHFCFNSELALNVIEKFMNHGGKFCNPEGDGNEIGFKKESVFFLDNDFRCKDYFVGIILLGLKFLRGKVTISSTEHVNQRSNFALEIAQQVKSNGITLVKNLTKLPWILE